MPKVEIYKTDDGGRAAMIYCPGCKSHHVFKLDKPQENGSMWKWNDDVDKPTFHPSMLVNASDNKSRCHSFVTSGNIKFLDDCFHALKNQTVELPEID